MSPSVAKRDPPDHLPHSQLAQLSRCIGCGLQWTSKKTAKQKRTHIQQCAKKNALTHDTIKILMDKETAGSSRSPPHEIETATLMDSVVPTAPIKKCRRQQVIPTVRSLPETRESILDKARDILGQIKGQADQPTQHFALSALSHRNAQRQKRSAPLDMDRSMAEPPPSTQAFRLSSLRDGISVNNPEGSSSSPQLFSGSMFDQESFLATNRHKRPASPPTPGSNVRRRLLQ